MAQIAACYNYCDEAGCLLYQVVRLEPKTFRQRVPRVVNPRDGSPEDWTWGLGGQSTVLFRLPELSRLAPGELVFVCEGEKDVGQLVACGLEATTSPLGAGKWRAEYSQCRRGLQVVVLPDNDDPGRKHAAQVSEALHGVAAAVAVLELPGLPPKGDVSDWFNAGGTGTELLEMARRALDDAVARARLTITGCEVTPRPVAWLWPNRLPLGKLVLFAGLGGVGKTFVLCDLTARISNGDSWPDDAVSAGPGDVLLISGEDDLEDTLVPRLIECHADLRRVHFLSGWSQGQFALDNLDLLDQILAEVGRPVQLVAIDPPTAFLGKSADDNSNAELRGLLHPLRLWAEKHRATVLLNNHLNKNASGKPLEASSRVLGSVAWVNASRAVYLCCRDGEDRERRLLLPVKQNLGVEQPGLAYRLVGTDSLARVEWLGIVESTAEEALEHRRGGGPLKVRDKRAADWLEAQFTGTEEISSRELLSKADSEHVSRNALFEAKKVLGIRAEQRWQPGGEGRQEGNVWYWIWTQEDKDLYSARKAIDGQ